MPTKSLEQLPLNMRLRDDATLESYYPVLNEQALSIISQMIEGNGEKFVYLWGSLGVGRSHLLQAACHAVRDAGHAAVYIPLQDFEQLSLELTEDLEAVSLVCIDDIHCIAGNRAWEEALFHLYNRIRAEKGSLLVAADMAPIHTSFNLPDLKSRLSWGVAFQLHALNDEQKLSALALRAKCRGLELNKVVGRFLLNHCPRNMLELFKTLELLDKASLADQRRLTVPFVKQVLLKSIL